MTRPPLELLLEQWEAWGADLDPVLDDVGDLAAASARRICAAQLREALRAQAEAGKDALESAQVIKDLGGLRVSVPMMQDPSTGERFIAPDVAELAHNVTQALRAQAEADAVIEEEAQARYADRLRVEQIDRLIGDREWDEAMTDPAIKALVLSNATHDRAYAARQATEQLIWRRVAALAQADAADAAGGAGVGAGGAR